MDYTNAGSIRYIAPEVLTDHVLPHPAIDIWALGVILYWLLFGKPPFTGNTKDEIRERIIKCEYKIDN